MLRNDYFIFMGVGGFFILFGLLLILWGNLEENSYARTLTSRPDLREFVERLPKHPQPGALRTGGWIAITVGLVLLFIGVINWYTR